MFSFKFANFMARLTDMKPISKWKLVMLSGYDGLNSQILLKPPILFFGWDVEIFTVIFAHHYVFTTVTILVLVLSVVISSEPCTSRFSWAIRAYVCLCHCSRVTTDEHLRLSVTGISSTVSSTLCLRRGKKALKEKLCNSRNSSQHLRHPVTAKSQIPDVGFWFSNEMCAEKEGLESGQGLLRNVLIALSMKQNCRQALGIALGSRPRWWYLWFFAQRPTVHWRTFFSAQVLSKCFPQNFWSRAITTRCLEFLFNLKRIYFPLWSFGYIEQVTSQAFEAESLASFIWSNCSFSWFSLVIVGIFHTIHRHAFKFCQEVNNKSF